MVASVGEQPEPGEEKIIRSQRHDHMIAEIFTFATGSRNNGYERQCGIRGKKQNYLCCSNLHWECEKTNMSEKGLWLCKSKKIIYSLSYDKVTVNSKQLAIQKLSILDFPFWRDHRKTYFSAPKGAISPNSTKLKKGVRLCNTTCMGLPWKI